MIQVVEVTFTCKEGFDAEREVRAAIVHHLFQITKKAQLVTTYAVNGIPAHTIEEVAQRRLAASIDELTIALNKLREEGTLT